MCVCACVCVCVCVFVYMCMYIYIYIYVYIYVYIYIYDRVGGVLAYAERCGAVGWGATGGPKVTERAGILRKPYANHNKPYDVGRVRVFVDLNLHLIL